MRLSLRHPWVWLGLGWVFIVCAIITSLLPVQKLPPTGMSDKLEHTIAYSLLTVWFTGVYPRSSYVRIGLAMLALGIAIEFAQGAMPFGRQMDFRDVIANSAGIAVGLVIAWIGIGGWAQRFEAWARKW